MATAVQPEHATGSCRWPTREEMEETLRTARRAVTTARYTAEDLAAEAAATVRRHPLQSIGAATIAGAVTGAAAGVSVGFLMRPRRRHWAW